MIGAPHRVQILPATYLLDLHQHHRTRGGRTNVIWPEYEWRDLSLRLRLLCDDRKILLSRLVDD